MSSAKRKGAKCVKRKYTASRRSPHNGQIQPKASKLTGPSAHLDPDCWCRPCQSAPKGVSRVLYRDSIMASCWAITPR